MPVSHCLTKLMFVAGTSPLHVRPLIDPPIIEPPLKKGLLALKKPLTVRLDAQEPANETVIGAFVVGPG